MEKLHYIVEVRDKEFKTYRTELGHRIRPFVFEDEEKDESVVRLICKSEYQKYKAVCKEGSIITIDVKYFNSISSTYSVLYSFDGEKFNKY